MGQPCPPNKQHTQGYEQKDQRHSEVGLFERYEGCTCRRNEYGQDPVGEFLNVLPFTHGERRERDNQSEF